MEPLRSQASERLAGLVKARVPMGALRLLIVVMAVFFSEDCLLRGEEKSTFLLKSAALRFLWLGLLGR